MFKKWSVNEHVKNVTQLKTSALRNIKKALVEQFPLLEQDMDVIFPKKNPVHVAKGENFVEFVVVDSVPWFFNIRGGPYFPTLRVLHMYPEMLPKVRVDQGAIKFVMKGSGIMCPGFTSEGGDVGDVQADTPVAVMAEGKDHALAVGLSKMSSQDMVSVNKGVAVDNINYLRDDLWLANKI